MSELLGFLAIAFVVVFLFIFVAMCFLFFLVMHRLDKQDKLLRAKALRIAPKPNEPPPPPKGPGPRDPRGKR